MGLFNSLKRAVLRSVYHRPDKETQHVLDCVDHLLVGLDPDLETVRDRLAHVKTVINTIEDLPQNKIVKIRSDKSDNGYLLLKPTKYGLEVSENVTDLLDL